MAEALCVAVFNGKVCGEPEHDPEGFGIHTICENDPSGFCEEAMCHHFVPPKATVATQDDKPDDDLWHAIHDELLCPPGVVEDGHHDAAPPHQCCQMADAIYERVKKIKVTDEMVTRLQDWMVKRGAGSASLSARDMLEVALNG